MDAQVPKKAAFTLNLDLNDPTEARLASCARRIGHRLTTFPLKIPRARSLFSK
jgi:hypothetical protein